MRIHEIFNKALLQHGKTCTKADVESSTPKWEIVLCQNFYRKAVLNVLGECDWVRYTQKIFFDPSYDFPEGGWMHGYLLPQGILRILPNSDQPYEIIRNKFLTNEERPYINAIMDTFDPEDAEDDFCELVSLAIAYELCGIIGPADPNVQTKIRQSYSWLLTPMVSAQSNAQIRSVEEGGPIGF